MFNEYVTLNKFKSSMSDELHTRVLKNHASDLPNLYILFERNPEN